MSTKRLILFCLFVAFLTCAILEGQVKFVVIPVNFSDTPNQVSAGAMESTVKKVIEFYGKNGVADFSYVIANPVTVNMPKPTSCPAPYFPTWNSFTGQATQLARTAGFSGTHPIWVHPAIPCPGSANGNLGSPGIWMHSSGVHLLAHEYGHNMRFKHAARLSTCPQNKIDFRRCFYNEYGDPYEVMGIGDGHLSLMNGASVGVVPQPTRVSADGTFTLSPIELRGPGSGLIVRRGMGDYYIERRMPIGLDTFMPEEKIIVRYAGGDIPWPTVGQVLTADLKTGESFVDVSGGMTITANGNGSVSVRHMAIPTPVPTPTPRPGTTPIRTLTPRPTGGVPCGPPWFDPCVTPTSTGTPTPTPASPTFTATAAPVATSTPTPTSVPTSVPVTATPTSAPAPSPTKKPTGGGGSSNNLPWIAGGLAALIAALALIFKKK